MDDAAREIGFTTCHGSLRTPGYMGTPAAKLQAGHPAPVRKEQAEVGRED